MALSEGIRTKLGYRICDWVGNTIIEPLPHPHLSTWTINGMQSAASGSVAVGNFTIPLYPPRSLEYLRYKGIYDKIKPGMRIEAYVANDTGEYMNAGGTTTLDVNASNLLSIDSIGGGPVFSGIIHKKNITLDKFELVGFDSLWLGQQTTMYPGMSYSNTGGGTILSAFNDIDNLALADDFNGNQFPSGITWATISGGTSLASDDGLPGYKSTTAGENILAATIASNPLINLSGAASGDAIIISAWFHVTNPSVVNAAFSVSDIVYASDNTGANLLLASCTCVGNGTTYDVKAQLYHKTAGTYTNDANITVFPGLTGDRRFQLILVITPSATNAWNVRLLINGKDSNCTASYIPSAPYNTINRYWGVRISGSGAVPTVTFTRFYMKARLGNISNDTNLTQVPVMPFTDNGGPTGTNFFNLTGLNGLTLLDLWSLGATLEGYIWRKDPIRLMPRSLGTGKNPPNDNGDGIIWGVQGVDSGAGNDFSKIDFATSGAVTPTVILDENTNIVSGGQIANGESLGSEVRLSFDSSPDSDGTIIWPDIAGMLSLGQGTPGGQAPIILVDSVSATGLHDMLMARKMAEQSGARKALSSQGSKQFTIIRDKLIASSQSYAYFPAPSTHSNTVTTLHIFKELDFILLNCPSIGIFNQKVSVQSYTFRENDPTMDVTLDQFSFKDKLFSDRRRLGAIEIIVQTVTQRA